MVLLRPFREEDLYDVVRLATRALDEGYDGGLFLHFARLYPEAFLVAEADGRVVGFIMGTIQRAYEARILALAVEDGYRRRRVASRLVTEFIHAFHPYGIKRVSLEVRVSNDAAIKLYERLGFESKMVVEKYYTDGEDAYVMATGIR